LAPFKQLSQGTQPPREVEERVGNNFRSERCLSSSSQFPSSSLFSSTATSAPDEHLRPATIIDPVLKAAINLAG